MDSPTELVDVEHSSCGCCWYVAEKHKKTGGFSGSGLWCVVASRRGVCRLQLWIVRLSWWAPNTLVGVVGIICRRKQRSGGFSGNGVLATRVCELLYWVVLLAW